jgi:hypothetical protein
MKDNDILDTKQKSQERYQLKYFNYARRWRIKHEYGITLEDYQRMLGAQKNCCAICGNSDSGSKGRYNTFAIDHNHKTGKVRGLLCNSCNLSVVPAVEYYESRLEATKKYLQKYQD